MISNTTEQAQTLLNEVEKAVLQVELNMNVTASKLKCVFFNQNVNADTQTLDGSNLKVVQDFKYLRSPIDSNQYDIQV